MKSAGHSRLLMGSSMCRTPPTPVIVRITTAGWLALTLTILQTLGLGPQQLLAAESGATAASPAMVPTCSWSPATHITQPEIGWVEKRLYGYKPDRPGPVRQPIIGLPLIG